MVFYRFYVTILYKLAFHSDKRLVNFLKAGCSAF